HRALDVARGESIGARVDAEVPARCVFGRQAERAREREGRSCGPARHGGSSGGQSRRGGVARRPEEGGNSKALVERDVRAWPDQPLDGGRGRGASRGRGIRQGIEIRKRPRLCAGREREDEREYRNECESADRRHFEAPRGGRSESTAALENARTLHAGFSSEQGPWSSGNWSRWARMGGAEGSGRATGTEFPEFL